MSSRNILRIDVADAYYHVYARGNNKQVIFFEQQDYWYFVHLFRRYLAPEVFKNKNGTPYPKLATDIEALCYYLMPNHFHLLFYQHTPGALTRLMRGVMTAYSMYINKKYKRRGPLFESRYKASLVTNDIYLQHISRYIHLNPHNWREYPYSSLRHFVDNIPSDWIKSEQITRIFTTTQEYLDFVLNYHAAKKEIEAIKHELADY